MMLSNFIKRNGKRKGNKVNGSRGHQQTPSTSSSVESSLVLDIKEGSSSIPTAQSSPLVELNLPGSNDAWFPQELLRTPNDLTQKAHVGSSPGESIRSASANVNFRKKSIPAPILIPGSSHLMPNVQIGYSAISPGVPPPDALQPNSDAVALKQPSPSTSENLSSISGATLARALIASSFILPPNERRGSRRCSVPRQDSATLPRGDIIFLSNQAKPSVPSVPPVYEKVASVPSTLSRPFTINSGASTMSEYPMTDSYITSPEVGSVKPQRIFSQETPSSTASASTKASPEPQRKVDPNLLHKRGVKNGVFDVPKTAVEVPLPINPQEATSQQGELPSVKREAHSLDEFDFVPPEPLVAFASPDSDSSASYISPPPMRNGVLRGQRKQRTGGLNLVRNASEDNGLAQDHEGYSKASAVTSEHDYGELLNYDLTVSPGSRSSSHGLSSTSAGYQTFPETPMVFSPLGSPAYAFLAKSDSMLRKTAWSPKYPRIGYGKPVSSARIATKKSDDNDGTSGPVTLRRSQLSSFLGQKTPAPALVESDLTPPQENGVGGKMDQGIGSLVLSQAKSQSSSLEDEITTRRYPIAHSMSSSSSCPAVKAPGAHPQPSSLPLCSMPNLVAPAIDLSTFVPLPESVDTSPSISPQSTGSMAAPSPFTNSLRSSLPSSNTAISESHFPKSPLSVPSSALAGSFLRSPLSSTSFYKSSSTPATLVSDTSDEAVSHSHPLSFVPPPPYHTVVSDRTLSIGPSFQHARQVSDPSVVSGVTRSRERARPPLPIGPRRPSGPGQFPGPFVLGIHDRNGSSSSVGSSSGRPKSVWSKLQSAVSKSPPKFQTPPPKWRGMTLEAAHWMFTSTELQEIVSQAIQQSSEGSSLRLMRLERLEGEVADEVHRLELQHTDVKAQYKALVRKRWMLMGALAGHMEGVGTNCTVATSRTMQELTDVLLVLDQLAEKMHEIALQLAQLRSLREVHNASALAMVVRKINSLFVRQTAEKERLLEQVRALQRERDEAWKQAEDIAQDYDMLNERVGETESRADVGLNANINADHVDVQPSINKRRSARISAVRRSAVRLSQAGLWPRSKLPAAPLRPTPFALEIPPIPGLIMNASPLSPVMGSAASFLDTGITLGSVYSSKNTGASVAWEFAEAQREVYEMLGLSVPPTGRASFMFRRRTLSGPEEPAKPNTLGSRPVSESFDDMRVWSRKDRARTTKSVMLDDRLHSVVAQHRSSSFLCDR